MIPPFQDLMLPIVKICEANGSESVPNRVFMVSLAEEFHLTDADRNELLSGGRQSRYENRVYWALVHLRRARLIETTGRGLNRITARGREILATQPSRIDLRSERGRVYTFDVLRSLWRCRLPAAQLIRWIDVWIRPPFATRCRVRRT